jgi:excisionase family DNA binding protein
MDPTDLPFLLTVKDVAAFLRTSRAAVYSMVERGRLPGVTRIGRRLLIRRDRLVDWLDRQSRAPSP